MKKALLNSFSAFKRVIVFSIVFSVLAVMLNVITVNAGASLIVIDNTYIVYYTNLVNKILFAVSIFFCFAKKG